MSREEAIIKVLKKAYFIEVAKYYYWVAHKATVENYKGCIPTEAKIHKLMDGKSARGTTRNLSLGRQPNSSSILAT